MKKKLERTEASVAGVEGVRMIRKEADQQGACPTEDKALLQKQVKRRWEYTLKICGLWRERDDLGMACRVLA